MAINFPATPTLNQTYTYNGRTWTYNGVGWQATGASGLSVYTKTTFTATAAQTTFSVTYTVGFVDVYYNGSKLSSSEYTATNGTSVVLGTACAVNDIVETIAWTVSTTLNPALGVATATSLAIGGATIGSNALAVTGTSTFSSTVTHSGATTLSGALTYGGVTLSNAVTGTGNMVLSASPTLTGTVNTQNVQPTANATHNIGGASNRYATGFIGQISDGATATSLLLSTAGTGVVHCAGTDWTYQTFNIAGTERARINASGLGIGMTPARTLDVTGTGGFSGNLNVGGTSNVATGTIGIGVANNAAVLVDGRLDANGNTYGYRFVNGSAGTAATTLAVLTNGTHALQQIMFGTAWTTSGIYRQGGGLITCDGPGGLTLATGAAQSMFFAINNVEKMKLDSSGDLLVGTTTNLGQSEFRKSGGDYVLRLTNTNASPYALRLGYSAADPNNATNTFIFADGTGGARFIVYSNGGIANYSANNVNLSDVGVKPFIENIADSADLSAALWEAHKNIDWNRHKYEDQTHDDWNYGYTAQGVRKAFAKVAPELVDFWEEGKSDKLAVYHHDVTNITGAVVTMLQSENEALKASIAELTTRLAALEAK